MTIGVILAILAVLAALCFIAGIFIAVHGWPRFRCAMTRHRWITLARVDHGTITQGPWAMEIPDSELQVCARCESAQLIPRKDPT